MSKRIFLGTLVLSLLLMASTEVLAQEGNEPSAGPQTTTWGESLNVNEGPAPLSDPEIKEKSQKGEKGIYRIFSAIENLSLSYGASETINFFRGQGIKVGYQTEAEPAFYGRYFHRLDEWSLGLDLDVVELFKDSSPLKMEIEPHVRILFYQFFDDLKSAANPKNIYLPTQMPQSAEEVLTKLKPGDLFILEGDLHYLLGAGKIFKYLEEQLRLTPSVGRIVNGQFRIYIFRGDGNSVRLRLAALRSTPLYAQVSVGIFDFIDLGWSFISRRMESLLKIKKLGQLEVNRFDQDMMIADYIVDITDPRVQAVLDNTLFHRQKRIAALMKASNPFLEEHELRNFLEKNLKELNELAVAEKKSVEPKVVVTFYGSNFANGSDRTSQGGVRGIWRGEGRSTKQDNRLTHTLFDEYGNQQKEYFFFPSWRKDTKKSALATTVRERRTQAANMIYKADDKHQIETFQNIGFYHEETDKSYSPEEHLANLAGFGRVLPPPVYQLLLQHLREKDWLSFKANRQNVRIDARYFIQKEGLQYVSNMRSTQIASYFANAIIDLDQHFEKKDYVDLQPTTGTRIPKCSKSRLRQLGIPVVGNKVGPYAYRFCRDILPLAKKLEKAFDSNRSYSDRHKTFASLTGNELFRFLGVGILFDMLPKDRMDEVAYFEIVINAAGLTTPVRFAYGEIADRAFYEFLLQIITSTADREPDLRLPGDEESFTRRILN